MRERRDSGGICTPMGTYSLVTATRETVMVLNAYLIVKGLGEGSRGHWSEVGDAVCLD